MTVRASLSVSGAGDVNGDGIDDLIIGAIDADPHGLRNAGESYVVFGRSTGFSAAFELRSLFPAAGGNGTTGFVLRGISIRDNSAYSVSGAGDVNGDGIDDLLIGAYEADHYGIEDGGESYVVFGRRTGFPAVFELRNLLPEAGGDGTSGFALFGIDDFDHSGRSVSNAGDVNGDGIDDLIIGADYASYPGPIYKGETYVVFGRMRRFPATFQLSSLLPEAGGDGTAGFVLTGINSYDHSGNSVSGAGDVNGDGIDDFIIGAYTADPNGDSEAGESYVVFGRTTGFPAVFELSSLTPEICEDGTEGFVIQGIDDGDFSGVSVSGAGDVNGDGIDDLIIGADEASYRAGESYVVFGRSTGFPRRLRAARSAAGRRRRRHRGFRLKGHR